MRLPAFLAALALAACADPVPPPAAPVPSTSRRFDDDLAFLRAHGPVEVLTAPGGGLVVVSARWQGRVMTSAVEPHGASLGFIHRAFLEAGKTGTAFDNYGGEDRFWLGPEGGPFGLYFPPGAPFVIGSWQTPHAMQEGEWAVRARDAGHVTFAATMRVTSWSGTTFDVGVERTVRVLSEADVRARFGDGPPPGTKWVAFESDNVITNTGARAWTRETGLLSIWILGMYAPAADARIVVPFDPAGTGPFVNDAYFGKIAPGRLTVHEREGWMGLVADGQERGKLGVGPARARAALGSFTPSARLLTLVHYDKPADAASGYVNSAWSQKGDPYGGDVVNAYNDGPTEPGKPSLGGFYEIETSSPAAALAPGGTMRHVHTTLHVVGDPASLEPLAKRVLGVSLGDVAR
ncbi:MAG TPA: DUF6786 family protein [Polyangiaceae bacterium]|nr:DUF6786 family protein [Polyangiaceae bacterium]